MDKSLDVANLSKSKYRHDRDCEIDQEDGYAMELLKACKYFTVFCVRVETMAPILQDEGSFHTFLCIDGEGTFECGNEILSFSKGDTIFVSAGSRQVKVSGEVDFLNISC